MFGKRGQANPIIKMTESFNVHTAIAVFEQKF